MADQWDEKARDFIATAKQLDIDDAHHNHDELYVDVVLSLGHIAAALREAYDAGRRSCAYGVQIATMREVWHDVMLGLDEDAAHTAADGLRGSGLWPAGVRVILRDGGRAEIVARSAAKLKTPESS